MIYNIILSISSLNSKYFEFVTVSLTFRRPPSSFHHHSHCLPHSNSDSVLALVICISHNLSSIEHVIGFIFLILYFPRFRKKGGGKFFCFLFPIHHFLRQVIFRLCNKPLLVDFVGCPSYAMTSCPSFNMTFSYKIMMKFFCLYI